MDPGISSLKVLPDTSIGIAMCGDYFRAHPSATAWSPRCHTRVASLDATQLAKIDVILRRIVDL